MVEFLRRAMMRNLLGLRTAEFALRERALRDVEERLLGEMADETRVCTMFDDRGRAWLSPRGHHSSQIHMTPVQRSLGGVFVCRPGVRVPDFDGRIDVEDAAVVTPLHDLAAVDIPGEVDEEVPGRQ